MGTIVVTGGAEDIGSHAVELLNSGNDVVVLDNFCNSSRQPTVTAPA